MLQLSSEIDRSNYIAFFAQSAHNSNALDDDDDDDDDKTKEARNEMWNGFDWLCHEWMKKCNSNFNRLYWNSDPVYLILSLLAHSSSPTFHTSVNFHGFIRQAFGWHFHRDAVLSLVGIFHFSSFHSVKRILYFFFISYQFCQSRSNFDVDV